MSTTTRDPKTAIRLMSAAPALLDALNLAVATIRIWHGHDLPPELELEAWKLYQSSPEMKKINAAIAEAVGP